MKIKRLFSVLGLGLFAAASAGVGALGLKNAQPKEANADTPNTWMVRFQLSLGECSPNDPDSCFPADKPVDGVRLHYWGDSVDAWTRAEHMFYFASDIYGVNVSLNDDQVIRGCQWVLEQRVEGDKYSVDITQFGSNLVTSLNKDTTIAGIQYQFQNSWNGEGKWELTNDTGVATSYLKVDVGIDDHTYYNFEKDPINNRFVASISLPSSDAIGFITEGNFVFESRIKDMLDTKSLDYIYGGTDNWWYAEFGSYDYILLNGTLKIRKNISEVVSVYLIGVDADVRIYTFGEGGIKEFGDFPGTRLGDILIADNVTGDLHFENNNVQIWRLRLSCGYPGGDHIIMTYLNELGNVGNQTADMLLLPGSAYWFSYEADYHNDEAGMALDFLLDLENFRNAADDDSICNISVSDAEGIINAYNLLSPVVRETYIDKTTINTHKRDGSEGKEYVSCRLIIEELGKIANVTPVGGSRYVPTDVNRTANITTIIIVLAVSLSLVGFTTLIVVRRRKHQ
jgi:hypothetical protein